MLFALAPILRFAQGAAPDIDPDAQRLMAWSAAKYAALESLRCTVWVPPYQTLSGRIPKGEFQPRAVVAYRRPGSILVQRIEPYGDRRGKVTREIRFKDGGVTLSSPFNSQRYLTYRYEPKPYGSIWDELANRSQAPVSELGTRIAGPKTTGDWTLVRMRLEPPTTASDGTPVYVVVANRQREVKGLPTQTGHLEYQIGQADGLLRRFEWSYGPPRPRYVQSGAQEYRDVVANGFVPDETFAFHPAPGMVAMAPSEWKETPQDKPTLGLIAKMRETIGKLSELSFVIESVETSASSNTKRVALRFDLMRPMLAWGEVREEWRDPVRVWTVVCDGRRIVGQGEGRREEEPVGPYPIINAQTISSFGNVGVQGVEGMARELVRFFLIPTEEGARLCFGRYRRTAPVVRNGTPYDVLEASSAISDEYGIPGGDVWTNRVLVGRADRLVHRWEWDHPLHYEGVAYSGRTVQTIRFDTDPHFDPSRFLIDP